MRPNHSLTLLLVLLALAVGYLAGTARQSTPAGSAEAGPTVLEPGSHSPLVTSSAEGNTLYLWRLNAGRLASATQYQFRTGRSNDVVTAELVALDATLPAPPYAK